MKEVARDVSKTRDVKGDAATADVAAADAGVMELGMVKVRNPLNPNFKASGLYPRRM